MIIQVCASGGLKRESNSLAPTLKLCRNHAGIPSHAESWLSTIEEAAGCKEAEREYLGRGDWKRLTKRMSVLPRKAGFAATPDFSKVAAPRKALRAFVAETRHAGSRLLFVAAAEDDLRAMERVPGKGE